MNDEREPTPLARALAERISREGPISVRDYMDACLNHPEHGYYRSRTAIGSGGDFITAPEISQVFGELIGLWAAVVWQQMGAPARVRLIELGPGRGTLMRDALRAVRKVSGFCDVLGVVLVEQNATLAALQRAALADAGVPVRWAGDLATVADEAADGAVILIANEFLDVLPVTQLELTSNGWTERGVTLSADGHLAFVTFGSMVPFPHPPGGAKPGDIVELCETGAVADPLGRLAAAGPLAALFIDYGYEGPAIGDTLQAMRGQQYENPLVSPGVADLTAHVDFAAFSADVRARGLAVDGPAPQAAFLGALGIVERTSRLMAANPAAAPALEAATARLTAPTGMGTLFRVIGVRSANLPPLPGL